MAKHFLAVVVVLAVLAVALTPTNAAKLRLRENKNIPNVPENWRDSVNKLMMMFEDDLEFHRSIQELLHKGGTVNYCLFECVTCNNAGLMTALQVEDVEGRIDFSLVPKTVTNLTFMRGLFRQKLELTELPSHVATLRFDGARFLQSTVVTFKKRLSGLVAFQCQDCGLSNFDWATLPSLSQLDLSRNPSLKQPDYLRLPATLRSLNMSRTMGTAETHQMPPIPKSIVEIDLSGNRIMGSLTVALPSSLELLNLAGNELSETLPSDWLPASIIHVDLSNNRLSGSLADLTAYVSLATLRLSHNNINSVAWGQLPPKIRQLELAHNGLSGHFDLKLLRSPFLTLIDVSHNKLEGTIDFARLPEVLEHLDVSNNQLSGTADFDNLHDRLRFLFVQDNKLSGKLDLSNLPLDLRRIVVARNDWESLLPPP